MDFFCTSSRNVACAIALAAVSSGCTIHTYSGRPTTSYAAFDRRPQVVYVSPHRERTRQPVVATRARDERHVITNKPASSHAQAAPKPTMIGSKGPRIATSTPVHGKPAQIKPVYAKPAQTKPAATQQDRQDFASGQVQLKPGEDDSHASAGGAASISERVAELARRTQQRLDREEAERTQARKERMNAALKAATRSKSES